MFRGKIILFVVLTYILTPQEKSIWAQDKPVLEYEPGELLTLTLHKFMQL